MIVSATAGRSVQRLQPPAHTTRALPGVVSEILRRKVTRRPYVRSSEHVPMSENRYQIAALPTWTHGRCPATDRPPAFGSTWCRARLVFPHFTRPTTYLSQPGTSDDSEGGPTREPDARAIGRLHPPPADPILSNDTHSQRGSRCGRSTDIYRSEDPYSTATVPRLGSYVHPRRRRLRRRGSCPSSEHAAPYAKQGTACRTP